MVVRGEAFLAWLGRAWAGTEAGAFGGRSPGVQRVSRPRAREGASARLELRFLSRAPPAVHVAPAAAVSPALPGLGTWEGELVVEGVFGEGVALGTEAPPDLRVHFPGNQQRAAIFRECCPFN